MSKIREAQAIVADDMKKWLMLYADMAPDKADRLGHELTHVIAAAADIALDDSEPDDAMIIRPMGSATACLYCSVRDLIQYVDRER